MNRTPNRSFKCTMPLESCCLYRAVFITHSVFQSCRKNIQFWFVCKWFYNSCVKEHFVILGAPNSEWKFKKISHGQPAQNYLQTSQNWIFFPQDASLRKADDLPSTRKVFGITFCNFCFFRPTNLPLLINICGRDWTVYSICNDLL